MTTHPIVKMKKASASKSNAHNFQSDAKLIPADDSVIKGWLDSLRGKITVPCICDQFVNTMFTKALKNT